MTRSWDVLTTAQRLKGGHWRGGTSSTRTTRFTGPICSTSSVGSFPTVDPRQCTCPFRTCRRFPLPRPTYLSALLHGRRLHFGRVGLRAMADVVFQKGFLTADEQRRVVAGVMGVSPGF